MTADSDKTQNPAPASVPVDVSTSAPTPMISRRMLLRGASAAVPTILTLGSGAALAASSNLISTNRNTGVQAEYGGTPCLSTISTDGEVRAGVYDLGPEPLGQVNIIPSGIEFRTEPNNGSGSTVLTPADMCYQDRYSSPFHYSDGKGGWKSVSVPQGGLCSAAAFASFVPPSGSGVEVKHLITY